MSFFDVAVITAVLCAVVAGVILAWMQRNYRRRVQILMKRLAEFEKKLPESGEYELEEEPAHASGSHHRGGGDSSVDVRSSFGNDPLSGRTSDVRRIIGGQNDQPLTLAEQAIRCVHAHLEEGFSVSQMADELHVSVRTLERGISTELECSPSQLITAMKMRAAKRLLSSGALRVNEVAMRLNFSSPEYFSRRFKKVFGISPSQVTPK